MKNEKENVLQKQKIIVRYLVSYPLLFTLFSFVKTKQKSHQLYCRSRLAKGQLISEAFFLGFKSPKKQMKCFEGFLH